jgi:glycosyltransferase involved in cell wall biosynthesis
MIESNRESPSVLLLTRYGRNGPSSRVRCDNYIPILERAGFHVTQAPFFDSEYIDALYSGRSYSRFNIIRDIAKRIRCLLSARRYDLIWIEKEILPWLPASFERNLLGGRPFVIDFDDAWHLNYSEHRNFVVRRVLRRKLERLATHAASVIVSNSFLADWARKSGARRVVELPSVVNTKHYAVEPPSDRPFTIGWIGTPVTQKYLQLVSEPLRHMQRTFGAKVHLIGASEDFSIPGLTFERIPWREETEARELSRFHVGIMPLTNGLWEQGKCGYKLMQYMASARPTVASPVGFNQALVLDGHTGFFASSTEEWIHALSLLAAEPATAERLGQAGRRHVEENYSLQATAPRLIRILGDVVAASKARRGIPNLISSCAPAAAPRIADV